MNQLRLSDLIKGDKCTIEKIGELQIKDTKRLLDLGIVPGKELKVVQVLRGTYEVEIIGATYVLGKGIVKNIYVNKY